MLDRAGAADRPIGKLTTLSLAAICETATLFLAWSHDAAIAAALAGHLATVVGFGLFGSRVFAADRILFHLSLMSIAIAGPIGALGMMFVVAWLWMRLPGADLNAWYRRLSGGQDEAPAVRLHEQILQARSFRPGRHAVDHLPSLLHAPLPKQQALLGLIGLDYHPEYAGLLREALHSEEPSIRAHAAAVSVKLRAKFKDELKAARLCIAESQDPSRRMNALARMRAAADSGFLDEAEAAAARAEALTCCSAHRDYSPEWHLLYLRLSADHEQWSSIRDDFKRRREPFNAGAKELYIRSLIELGDAPGINELIGPTRSSSIASGGAYACG